MKLIIIEVKFIIMRNNQVLNNQSEVSYCWKRFHHAAVGRWGHSSSLLINILEYPSD